jgi:hypothetical protein
VNGFVNETREATAEMAWNATRFAGRAIGDHLLVDVSGDNVERLRLH